MDHQMQKARNIGLEALRRGGFVRRGLGVGGQFWPLCNEDWGRKPRPEAAAGNDIGAMAAGFKIFAGFSEV